MSHATNLIDEQYWQKSLPFAERGVIDTVVHYAHRVIPERSPLWWGPEHTQYVLRAGVRAKLRHYRSSKPAWALPQLEAAMEAAYARLVARNGKLFASLA